MEELDELNSPLVVRKLDGSIVEVLDCLDCMRLRAMWNRFHEEKAA